MAEYVFLALDCTGSVTGKQSADLDSDIHALKRACQLGDGQSIEVRRGDIWLASVNPPPSPA